MIAINFVCSYNSCLNGMIFQRWFLSMTSEQLRYFITIVDTGSYMDAALYLDITQSSISKQIQALERELGVTLFDRSRRKAALTFEGKRLLPEARSLLERIDHLMYSASMLSPENSSRFNVVTLPFVGYLGLYAPLGHFEINHPECILNVMEMEEPQLMRRMINNDFDLAVNYEFEYRLSNSEQDFFPIVEDEVVFALHNEHPLAAHDTLSFDDIGSEPLFLMMPYTCISKLCVQRFREEDFIPNVIFRGRPETIFGGAEAGRGIAMLTEKQAKCYMTKDVKTIPLERRLRVIIGAVPGRNKRQKQQTDDLLSLLTACTHIAMR